MTLTDTSAKYYCSLTRDCIVCHQIHLFHFYFHLSHLSQYRLNGTIYSYLQRLFLTKNLFYSLKPFKAL